LIDCIRKVAGSNHTRDVAPCVAESLAVNLESCNSLLLFVHTLLVNILRCVRL